MAASPTNSPTTSFGGNALRLMSGSVAAQGIIVLATPILTRMFAPVSFGVAAAFVAVTGVLGTISCLRYELSIVLPETDKEAASLFIISLTVATAFTAFLTLFTYFFGDNTLSLLSLSSLHPYKWLIPLSVWLLGLSQALNYWNTRDKQFSRLSFFRVTNSLGTTGGRLGFGFAGHATSATLILTQIVGQTISTFYLATPTLFSKSSNLRKISFQSLLASANRYRKFPLVSTWSTLLNSASWQLPVIMLGAIYSPSIAGLYAVGFKFIQLPISIIGQSLGQVFLQEASNAKLKGKLDTTVESLFRRLLDIGLVPVAILSLTGREIFEYALGSQWAESGTYAQILGVWVFFWFISGPFTQLFAVLERQGSGFIFSLSLFISRLLSLGTGLYFPNPRVPITLFSVTGIIVYVAMLFYIVTASRCHLANIALTIIKRSTKAIIFILPTLVIEIVGLDTLSATIGILTVVVYGIFLGVKLMSERATRTQSG